MKTTQIMKRDFFGKDVRQDHKTGFLCITDFINIANQWRKENGIGKKEQSPKILGKFFELEGSKDFITELAIEENCLQKDLKVVKRGSLTGTWVHPSLFLKIALWTSPKLEVKVYRWIMDELLSSRDSGGESFKDMMSILKNRYPEMTQNPIWYKRVSRVIYNLCEVQGKDKDRWNSATVEQLKKREQIHEQLVLLCESYDSIGDLLVYVWNYNIKKGCKPKIENNKIP